MPEVLNVAMIDEIIPVNSISGNVQVAFGVFSYAGALTVTVVADADLAKLLRTGGIVAGALEQELGIYLNDREEIVQLVRDVAGRLAGFLQIRSSFFEVDSRRLQFLLACAA